MSKIKYKSVYGILNNKDITIRYKIHNVEFNSTKVLNVEKIVFSSILRFAS